MNRVNCVGLLLAVLFAPSARADEYTGQRFTFFADPDGLPLELYERVVNPDSRQ